MSKLKVEYIPTEQLKPYDGNAKIHTNEQIDQIKASIEEFGFNDPIAVWKENEIIEGHGRLLAAIDLDIEEVPIIRLDELTDEQRRAYMLVHNQLTMNTGFDFDTLNIELEEIIDIDMAEFGFQTEFSRLQAQNEQINTHELAEDFIIPPFDVFDARKGEWADKKREWLDKIGDNGQARSHAKAYDNLSMSSDRYPKLGKLPTGTSILDPVLSEVVLKWFTPHEKCNCFDCFAGDTVFGYVAASLGHNFTGIELRQEQCDFNAEHTAGLPCVYICDDGRNVDRHIKKRISRLLV